MLGGESRERERGKDDFVGNSKIGVIFNGTEIEWRQSSVRLHFYPLEVRRISTFPRKFEMFLNFTPSLSMLQLQMMTVEIWKIHSCTRKSEVRKFLLAPQIVILTKMTPMMRCLVPFFFICLLRKLEINKSLVYKLVLGACDEI